MPNFTLPRTGSAPVRIDGGRIAFVETTAAHPNERLWYTLSIYRLADARYCYALGYRSSWIQEKPWDWCVVVPNERALVTALEDIHEPPDVGWPPGEKYEARQRAFNRDLESHYRSAVQRAMEESGITLGPDDAVADVECSEFVARLDALVESPTDNEIIHGKADAILLEALRSAGMGDVADAWERVDSAVGFWYA